MGMRVEIIMITREIAKEFLTHNVRNIRPITKSVVDRYATSMRNGTWEKNGDPIQFYENGDLFNGQHRLMAIVETGIPQEMIVVYGIKDDVTVTDTGTSRNAKTLSNAMGGNCTTNMLSAASIMVSGIKNVSKAKTPREIIAKYAVEHEDDLRFATNLAGIGGKNAILKKGYAIALFYCYLRLCGNNTETIQKIDSFARCVNTGFYSNELETPAIILRNYLLNNKNMTKSAYYVRLMSTIDQAFNSFQKSKRKMPFVPNENIIGLVQTVRVMDGVIEEE